MKERNSKVALHEMLNDKEIIVDDFETPGGLSSQEINLSEALN